jgi:tetratricopeptide (TPR) repeat protein
MSSDPSRGIAYASKGQYDLAIQDYEQAIKLNPSLAGVGLGGYRIEVYNQRGKAFAKKERYDNAIHDFNQVIGLDPKNAEAFYNRGIAKIKKGDDAGAAADMATAKSINPNIGR